MKHVLLLSQQLCRNTLILFHSPSGSRRILPFSRGRAVIQPQLNNKFHPLSRVTCSECTCNTSPASESYQIFPGTIRKRNFFTGIVGCNKNVSCNYFCHNMRNLLGKKTNRKQNRMRD